MYTVTVTAGPNGSVSIQDPKGLDGIFSYTLEAGESRVTRYTDSQFDNIKPILDTLVSAGFMTYTYIDGSSSEISNASAVAGATVTDALNTLSSGSGGTRFGWTYKVAVLDADPGAGNFRLNNLNPTLATFIYISEHTSEGVDVSSILAEIQKNVSISIDQTGVSEAMILYTCSGAPTDAGVYYKIPVTYVDRGPDPMVGDSLCDIEFVMAFAHKLGGELHEVDTLAHLNSKISDATLDDSGDSRTPLAHAPSHAGGTDALTPGDIGAEPEITPKGTAFNVDFGTTGGTACEGDDARLSDDRTPLAHAPSHAGGTDALTPGDIGAEPEITPKGTAFNKDFGTVADTVCEGSYVTSIAAMSTSAAGVVAAIEAKLKEPYTVLHTDATAASLNTAIAGLSDGDIIEVDPATVAVYDPITIPANKALVIRPAFGKKIQITGTGCIKLANGARDTIIAGVDIQSAVTPSLNDQGAAVTFAVHQTMVSNISFYDLSVGAVSSGSAVMLSYHWSVGGDLYYTPSIPAEWSTDVRFINCSFDDADTDINEGAAVVLRGINGAFIVNTTAIDDTLDTRGILLQNCVNSYVADNYVRIAGTTGANGEGIKIDEIGTGCIYRSTATLLRNVVENCEEGIDIDDKATVYAMDNVCINCIDEGISVDGGTPNGIAVLIRNTCFGAKTTGTSAGIYIESGAVVEMYENNCVNNSMNYRNASAYVIPASNLSKLTPALRECAGINETVAADVVLVATGGTGSDAGTLTSDLKNTVDGSALARAGIVKIICSDTQYAGSEDKNANVTFGATTKGSVLLSSGGYAVIKHDVNGQFAGALSNTSDEIVWFSAATCDGGIDDVTKGIVVRGCVPDDATWS